MREFLKCALMGVIVVINMILFLTTFFGFVCFLVNLAYGDIEPIFKSFMLGFGGLFFGMVVYDCAGILWEKLF